MRSFGFWNRSGILAALSLLILAGPSTPFAETGSEPAAVSETVGPPLRDEIRALGEELCAATAQIQIIRSTIDAIAAQSAARALAKQDELKAARTRGGERGDAALASTLPVDPRGAEHMAEHKPLASLEGAGGGEASGATMVPPGQNQSSVRLVTGDPRPLRGDDFLWPLKGKVIGAFGPIDQWRRRDGIDIAARRGAPVLAAQDGLVAYAGAGLRGYGQIILLRHDQGYITTYVHNGTLLVDVGDTVKRGQIIARVADTGDATESMLHFELRQGRTPLNPQTRLISDTTTLASTIE